MRQNPKTRFLPVVILPAILPALVVPPMRSAHVPDYLVGATIGFCIGLAIVGIAWMVKSINRGSTDC